MEQATDPRPAGLLGSSGQRQLLVSLPGKRLLDFLCAALVLIVLSPLLLLIALLVKLTSSGPALFRQVRVGRNGREFTLLKFRTMTHNRTQAGPGITRRGDARITPVGRVLRKWKLDEWPQFINVAAGDMSLVGPRPDLAQYWSALPADPRRVLCLRPGITGRATLQFRNEEEILGQVPAEQITSYYLNTLLPESSSGLGICSTGHLVERLQGATGYGPCHLRAGPIAPMTDSLKPQPVGDFTQPVLVLSHVFPNPLNPNFGTFVFGTQVQGTSAGWASKSLSSARSMAPPLLRVFYLRRKSHKVPERDEIAGCPAVEYPKVLTLPGGHLFFLEGFIHYLRCRKLVRRLVKEKKAALIHAHTILPDGLAAVLLGREFKLPVVCTLHGSDIRFYPYRDRITLRLTRWTLRKVNRLIAVSSELKDNVFSLSGVSDVSVIRNSADPRAFKSISRLQARRPTRSVSTGKKEDSSVCGKPEAGQRR